MDKKSISAALETEWAGRTLEYYDIIDSTNNVADNAGIRGEKTGFLAVADRQDAGRGSRGRNWISPSGYNIFMSIMVRPDILMENVSGLTLVMALSVAQAIEEVAPLFRGKLGIKWPNDVVLNGRKICGILTELHPMPEGTSYYVVIGVGINVNQPGDLFSEEISNIAGSVFSETGQEVDRNRLIASCMKCFEENYEVYGKRSDMTDLKGAYELRLLNKGKQVKILDPKGEYTATADGITNKGALIITCIDGTTQEINAGEVSVRGLYGYT